MGLILDPSILIADERGKFDLPGFLRSFPSPRTLISAITASELLHGVERADDPGWRARRRRRVEQMLANLFIQPFDLAQARCHARIWAELETRGQMIGPHDLQIAALGIAFDHDLATLNAREFQRVADLRLVETKAFCLP